MRIPFLGTGGSCGTPMIGCRCEVCTSADPRDRRLRSSVMVESGSTRLLVDCGPDFRQQALAMPFRRIDAVLLTHPHYDHVGGMDDLRPFCKFDGIDVFANRITADCVRHNFPYCFDSDKYPGVPDIRLRVIEPHRLLRVGDIDIMPVEVMHDSLPILGYRFGRLAYITDMKTIADSELEYLDGVEVLAVNALRFERPHHSHQLVADAIAFSRRVGAHRTLFVHSCHHIGLHAEANARLPQGFELAYDGQTLDF